MSVSRLKKLFRRKGFLVAVGMLAVAMIIWFFGREIGFGTPPTYPLGEVIPRIIAISLFFACVLAYFFIRYLISIVRAQRLKEKSVETVSSQKDIQVEQIQTRFNDAVEQLEGRAGKAAMERLPWFLVLGPSGAGKTVLIKNSGLDYPYESASNEGFVEGSGGTLNCKWWLSTEGIFLDTAGRYVQQDSSPDADKAEWFAFLNLLRSSRSKQPVNGIIAVLSVEDLLAKYKTDANALREEALRLRQRIDEVCSHFHMRLPIYLVLGKCDLIPGFNEFFLDRNSVARRAEIWGVDFDEQELKGLTFIDSARNKLNDLVATLRRQTLTRLQENSLETRTHLQAFPDNVAQLMPSLLEFIRLAFSEEDFRKSLFLRGCYLTSATQEGAPLDRLMSSLHNDFGVNYSSQGRVQGQGKSFFVNALIQEKILAEQSLSGISSRWSRYQYGILWSGITVSALLLTFLFFGWVIGFNANERFLTRTQSELAKVDEAELSVPSDGVVNVDDMHARLDALWRLREDIYQKTQDSSFFMTGLGLDTSADVIQRIEGNYEQGLTNLFQPFLMASLLDYIRIENLNVRERYSVLKLLVGLSPTHTSPSFNAFGLQESREFNTLLRDWWQSLLRQSGVGDDRSEILVTHLDELQKKGITPVKFDEKLIADNQKRFNDMLPVDFVFELMIATFEPELPEQNLYEVEARSAFFQCFEGAESQLSIPSIYSKQGIDHLLGEGELEKFVNVIVDEHWVLGKAKTKRRAELLAEVKRAYVKAYIDAWQRALQRLKIKTFADTETGIRTLKACAQEPSPFSGLLRKIALHTSFPDVAKDAKNSEIERQARRIASASGRVARSVSHIFTNKQKVESVNPKLLIHQEFKHLNAISTADDRTGKIADILENFVLLRKELEQSANASHYSPSLGAGLGLRAGAEGGVSASSAQLFASLPQPVSMWLEDLAYSVDRTSNNVSADVTVKNIVDNWNNHLLPICQNIIKDRYPFQRHSQNDVPIQAFEDLFGPGRQFEQFFREQLLEFVDTSRRPWRWRSNAEAISARLPEGILSVMEKAFIIRDAFFPQPIRLVFYPITLTNNNTRFVLNVGGKELIYRQGPTSIEEMKVPMSWPSPDFGSASYAFTGLRGPGPKKQYIGDWALFRLLDNATVSPAKNCGTSSGSLSCANHMELKLSADGHGATDRHEATIGLYVNQIKNPYSASVKNTLRRFRCDAL